MSEQSLVEWVMAANPVPDPDSLPEGTIDVRTLRNYVANAPQPATDAVTGLGSPTIAPPRVGWQRGLRLAAAAFLVVLALGIGFWVARSGGEADVVEPPRVTTTIPPATTAPPTTQAIEEGAPVPPEALSLIGDFVAALDGRDPARARALVADGAGATQVDAIATADQFDDGYELGDCLDFGGSVRCEVAVTDFFIDQLDLQPSRQAWDIEVEQRAIIRLDVSGGSAEVALAVSDFAGFVAARDPAAPSLLDPAGNWVRAAATIEAASPHLVEFAALRSGISPDTWATIDGYFTTLSAGDLDAFESLLAPQAVFEERSGPNGDATVRYMRGQDQFLGHFSFEYLALNTDTQPLKCTGDATSVSCRARNTGVLQLDTGGFEDGTLLFDLESGLITSIRDRFNLPQLQTFCQGWIFENYPGDLTDIWTCGGTDIPETPEIARLLLEWYPRYLAESGTDVPPEYLDGSLLEN